MYVHTLKQIFRVGVAHRDTEINALLQNYPTQQEHLIASIEV